MDDMDDKAHAQATGIEREGAKLHGTSVLLNIRNDEADRATHPRRFSGCQVCTMQFRIPRNAFLVEMQEAKDER